jgi:integrase
MFMMLAGTGIRVSELAGLSVEDIDISQQRLRVHAKAGSRQQRYLSRNLCLLLQRYLSGRMSGPLFSNGRGIRRTNRHIARRLKMWAERSSKTQVFSTLRD